MKKITKEGQSKRANRGVAMGAVVIATAASVLAFGGQGVVGAPKGGAAQMKVGDVKLPDDLRLGSQTSRFKVLGKFNAHIPVLKKPAFEQTFGGNNLIPRNSQAIRALSKRLFSAEGRSQLDECAEFEYGNLFAALANPDVSDADRDAVDSDADASMPTFNKSYTSGHFRFQYTDNNANSKHNSTLNDIKATATVLNAAWDDYTANFKKPKHYLKLVTVFPPKFDEMIDVKCYDLGDSLYGVTNSSWNHIELNSNKVVNNANRRKTTPVHELFHRVEYSYGYVTGTPNMKWAVEATASWSQKYRAPEVGDWMGRINSGLQSPDGDLTSRSYDVCGMWCYMGQRAGNERNFIKKAWSEYNITNAYNMKLALQKAIQAQIPNGTSLDQLIGWWNFTNFYKDMANAASSFDYAEDENGAGGFGPLQSVPTTNKTLTKGGAAVASSGSCASYGADYHVYSLSGSPTKVEIKITTTGKFGYALIKYKGSTMQSQGYSRTPSGGNGNYTYTETINPATTDKVALVVIGNPTGGSYSISAKAL